MWYLILATCVAGAAEGEAMTCTEAELVSKHDTLAFCEQEMVKYAESKIAVLCLDKAAVKVEVWNGPQ